MKFFKPLIELFGLNRLPNETAEDRRRKKDRSGNHYVAPRSMTPAERDYYAIHKNLNGFYSTQ